MSSYPSDYYGYGSYNIPYASNYEQTPAYGYSNAYLPASSPNHGSVPMSISTSGSSLASQGSHNSYNSRNSPYTYPSSPDELYNSQTISPSASNSYPPMIDFSYTAPVNTSTKGSHKQRTSSNPGSHSNTKPGTLCCLHAGCEYQTKRQYDLDRHQKTHFPSTEKYDCTGRGCGRTGEYGFDRKDHLREHLRKVHAKDIPKQGRRRSSKSPTQRRG